jgi:hypothetical protein
MKTQIGCICMLAFFVVRCTKEVKIKLPTFEQKLVVDGQIRPGIPPIIILSKSQDLYASTSLDAIQNNYVTDAVCIVSNGTVSDTLDLLCSDSLPPQFQDYLANVLNVTAGNVAQANFCAFSTLNTALFGEIGKTYTLTILYNGKTYTSSTTLMPQPIVSSTFYKNNGQYSDRGYAWIVIKDDPNAYNTYFLRVKSQKDNLRFHTINGPAFDDAFFNGLEFKLGVYNAGSYDIDSLSDDEKGYFFIGDTAIIELSSMDNNVYQFNLQKYTQVDNGGNPFAMPSNIPSNIVGGALGVFAGYTPLYDTIPCYP